MVDGPLFLSLCESTHSSIYSSIRLPFNLSVSLPFLLFLILDVLSSFLDASSHLYKRVGPSVRPSVTSYFQNLKMKDFLRKCHLGYPDYRSARNRRCASIKIASTPPYSPNDCVKLADFLAMTSS